MHILCVPVLDEASHGCPFIEHEPKLQKVAPLSTVEQRQQTNS